MKNFLFIALLWTLSFVGLYWLGGIIFPSNDEASTTSASSLQAAVTFGGVNYLNVFIYFILACIMTTIVFFSLKSRRSS